MFFAAMDAPPKFVRAAQRCRQILQNRYFPSPQEHLRFRRTCRRKRFSGRFCRHFLTGRRPAKRSPNEAFPRRQIVKTSLGGYAAFTHPQRAHTDCPPHGCLLFLRFSSGMRAASDVAAEGYSRSTFCKPFCKRASASEWFSSSSGVKSPRERFGKAYPHGAVARSFAGDCLSPVVQGLESFGWSRTNLPRRE